MNNNIKMMEIKINEIAQKKFEYWKEEFIKELLKISKENNWEVAIDDGYKDGFKIISGEEWIKNKLELKNEKTSFTGTKKIPKKVKNSFWATKSGFEE